ncbi:class I lanthipeptide [Chitinophaga qingshengii]|uniref:Class I lanthipeptide n=1 Tax=Chitinophaga qingshengii TaxID=1569794 RepID=A0ABR7TQU3_9BACT|nr:class I lanthipeptide [Chitinophaga qingshengii]MBC9932854.1 class I lanthipeptide [Chitinophaga qingshengii]
MKKKVAIGKKMSFNKTTIAHLNDQQQSLVAGGVAIITLQLNCHTRQETCETIPYTQRTCVRCPD